MTPLRIGLVCHSSLGGSGVIATELGLALARRGHDVHFFSAGTPPRLEAGTPNVTLHTVHTPTHALFPGGEYALALASKLAEVSAARQLDVLHVHYAIPHATSAYLARAMLGAKAPKLVTTLHGTDVLTLGVDPSLHPVLRHSICASDALTVPTRYLSDEVTRAFAPAQSAEVIGNFVDTAHFAPATKPATPTLIHNSSFRPLKRVDDVVRVFAKVHAKLPAAKLVLIGDGPMRPHIEALSQGLPVHFAGELPDVVSALQGSSVFLFPSETESFGLAALEAMSCGLPVIASRTGGLPELIDDGVTGFLQSVGDVSGMADRALALLTDDALWSRLSAAAREAAVTRWQQNGKVDLYEATYRRVLARG